ncbi:MAG: hypothetical protein ACRELC_00285, partial [Gemmatimonadota bacterium]
MIRRGLRDAALCLLAAGGSGWTAPAAAQGHGPIYGLSTPTLGRGAWSVDAALMSRFVEGGQAIMARPMVSYGVTEDVQLSASFPLRLERDEGLPAVRGLARMPMTPDVQLMLGWRFQRSGVAVGSRWESTAWLAFEHPTDEVRSGVEASPALYGAAVTGYASRSWYAWVGAGHRRHTGASGDDEGRPGDATLASLVVGYRPPAFRADPPHPDWRAFLELVGEWIGRDTSGSEPRPDSGGRQVFLGLT